LSEKEIINSIPNIHDIYDEPFSDSGGALQVSTLAGNHVKVALSGDGGDELFAGYDVYSKLNRVHNIFSKIPSNIRNIIFNVMSSIHPNISNYPLSLILELVNRKTTIPLSMRVDQLILALKSLSHIDFYRLMKSNGLIEQQIMEKRHLNSRNPLRFDTSDLDEFVSSLLYYDQVDYLPSDILVKADRTSMSVGLENRAPLLDHRIVEFSWQLSNDMKIRNGINKWPLRQVLYRYVPQNLVDRPKMGFNLPMSEWLRGPLRSWTEDLLSKELIERHGIFNADHVQSILKQHMEGKYNWQATLWRLMAFQSWLLNR
jgi:asparagine synthase (glutamine-hydrolysing)